MISSARLIPDFDLQSGESEVGLDLVELAAEAREYLLAHDWCEEVESLFYDRGFPKVAVFLANIVPMGSADSQLWVIVGDVPPLYIDTVDYENGAEALAGYLIVFLHAIMLFRTDQPLDDVPPILTRGSLVEMSFDDEVAKMLSGRLTAIRKMLLELWSDEIRFDISELYIPPGFAPHPA